MSDEEWAASRQHFSPKFRAQIPIVRAALLRSDLLVVPSQSMAERVLRVHPKLHDRVVVRFHPLLQPPRRRPTGEGRKVILCPVVPSPYKDLDTHLTAIARALSGREDIEVVMTMSPADAPPKLRERKLFRFCGVLPREDLEEIYSTCAAVYYPTLVESFGYPLAEARAAGIPVIAQDIAHNRDIAGGALFGFQYADDESLADAVDRALDTDLIADPAPFDPESYFKWLLD
ncbi:hypothetical protein C6Y44_20610 [Rhodococcus rhodochrous]|nr:hypothetical protein C6Y44_20610 [Rhodococcus rhodochrous]